MLSSNRKDHLDSVTAICDAELIHAIFQMDHDVSRVDAP